MEAFHLDPADLGADEKAHAALARFRLSIVKSHAGPDFDRAYDALFAVFGERGEFERREVVAHWIARGSHDLPGDPALAWRYALLVARDASGDLAAVRDCHVTIDRQHRITVIYLAHALVLPAYRRTGLGAVLRAAPIAIARRALKSLGEDTAHHEILLAAEMDPWERAVPASLVRLVAYGRSGFAAIDPRVLPYCQPDFRDPAEIGDVPRNLPFLAVVRRSGHATASALPRSLAEAYVHHLYAVFATHCLPEHLAKPREHALATLAASGLERVPLLPLPKGVDDDEALAPLARAMVLPFHLPVSNE